jgi:hypothetical protein
MASMVLAGLTMVPSVSAAECVAGLLPVVVCPATRPVCTSSPPLTADACDLIEDVLDIARDPLVLVYDVVTPPVYCIVAAVFSVPVPQYPNAILACV